MVLLSASSVAEDSRSPVTYPHPDSSNGFQRRFSSHFTMQKQRSSHASLPDVDCANSCKTPSSIQEQIIPSVAWSSQFQRSWSVDCQTVHDETLGLSYNSPADLAFDRMDKPIVQKSLSESGLRKRRSGHYKNDYVSDLLVSRHDCLISDGDFAKISSPNNYIVEVESVQSSLSSTSWADRRVSDDFILSSPDMKPKANLSTSVDKQGLMKQRYHLNGASMSCHFTENVATAKSDYSDFSNIILNTPRPIFDQFGVIIGSSVTSGKDVSGDETAKPSRKLNFTGNSGNCETLSTTNGHSKAVRRSSYPMKLSQTAVNNSPHRRRESVQSINTSLPRYSQNSSTLYENDKMKKIQKTNVSGVACSFQPSTIINGHSKTVRSSPSTTNNGLSKTVQSSPSTTNNGLSKTVQSSPSTTNNGLSKTVQSSPSTTNNGLSKTVQSSPSTTNNGLSKTVQSSPSTTNNGHSKAVRCSSFPLKMPHTSLSNGAPNRRQSVQSFDTLLARSVQDRSDLTHADGAFCFVPISDIKIMIPKGSNKHHYLQRTLSDGPRACDLAQVLAKAPTFREMESEYVTLDQRYELPEHSKMNWVTETAGSTSNGCTVRQYCNGYTKSINEPRIFKINNNKSRLIHTSDKLQVSPNIKHAVRNNPLLHSSKSNQRWMNGTGTLNFNNYNSCTFYDKTGSVQPTHIPDITDREFLEYSNRKVSSQNGSTNKVTICENKKSGELKRCKSLSDLQDNTNDVSEFNSKFSDDEDGDDFGFLSYPISFSSSCPSAAMNKAKSPSPGTRIFPKRWRNKSKAVPAVANSVAMWTPGPPGSCAWSSVSGRKVQLRPVSILNLSEPERLILQKIALSKLQTMDIGCPVSIPGENSDHRRRKKSLSLKRRSKSVTSTLDLMVKDGTASGLVFGIPLAKCLMNDRELDKKRNGCSVPSTGSPPSIKIRTNSSDNLQVPRSPRKSSNSSQGSIEIGNGKHEFPFHKRATSIDSLPESECSRNTSSSLIDALSLPASNPASRLNSLAMDSIQQSGQGEAQVPNIVKACFRHIETYGLQTLGIFRVGSSKKRVKQLREEFDSGRNVQLTEEHNPHDVGALLKEYFRDLPDPLLTRELYLPFIYAERMKDDNKRHLALRLLISMLPVTNRDTLWALLQFLATVSQHAPDTTDDKGETVAGNKMDAHNLATLFGPNIIHRTKIDKSSDKEMLSESAERVGQSKEIIEVVKDMIDNHHDLFEISGELRDEILRLLVESNQEVADRILRHIANQNQIETDPESMCSVFEDSASSPTLYHSMNSDADLLAYAQKQTSASHRPLRITKSADDSLDSPVLKSRAALLSDSQAFSPASKDNHILMPLNSTSSAHQLNTRDNHSSPLPNRVPVLRFYSEFGVPDSSKSPGSQDYPCSEGFHNSLNIPRPLYFRESSSSSISSDLSSLNGHGWSENGFQSQWALPTPPTSRSASPKALFQSTSSSSTLVASPVPSLLNHPQDQDGSHNYKPAFGSAEWERDRWKHWEKIAAQKKKKTDKEQETLV